jgi:hypothetical protein
MSKKDIYSQILLEFATPLLRESDTLDIYYQKLKVAEVIWNYCIVKEFNLPSIKLFEETIENLRKSDPIMDELIDIFIDIKNEEFFQYKNFIAKNEIKTHDDGHHSIIVQSCAPEDYTKVFNMENMKK